MQDFLDVNLDFIALQLSLYQETAKSIQLL